MKNLLLFSLGLVIGAGVFYIFCEKSKSNAVQSEAIFLSDTTNRSGKIEKSLAEKMINAYRLLPISNQIVSSENQKLQGFFIKKADFMKIFSDKNVNGIYFNLALDEKYMDKIPVTNALTLVFSGATINQNKTKDTEPNFFTSEQFYDKIEPCPPYCGN